MSRRNRRVVLRWWLVIAGFAGLVVACAPEPNADDGQPENVRVQMYEDPRSGGKTCLVFTHDTGQGASIAVSCP